MSRRQPGINNNNNSNNNTIINSMWYVVICNIIIFNNYIYYLLNQANVRTPSFVLYPRIELTRLCVAANSGVIANAS